MNKKKKFAALFSLLIAFAIISFGGYQISKANSNQKQVGTVGSESNNNSFSIRNNATDYQNEIYESLNQAIKDKNDEKITALIAQNFVADFFTWTNKVRLNDVGGLQFIHEDAVNSVSHAAQDGIYNDMHTYLFEGKGDQTLEVDSSTAVAKKAEFKYNDEIVDAYSVDVTWTYKESTALNTALYQNEATVVLIQDSDGLYSIVEVNNNEKE